MNVYNSVNFPNPFTSLPVPGHPGRYATDGITNGDTNDSHGTTVGPFGQLTWRPAEQFNVVVGGRLDRFNASVTEPLLAARPHASISVWIPNYNASLVYKPTAASSVYVTYNKSKNTSGAVGNGGGITGWNAAGTALFKDNFLQPSELLELGTKYSLLQNKMFLNFAVFDQKRTFKSTSSTIIQQFKTKGFEAEMNYQPDKHLYGTLSYSYIDAKSTPGFQSDGGVGRFFASTSAETRVSGLPQHQVNGLISYTFDNGWSISSNANYTGSMSNNTAGTLIIPSQYQLDGSVAYHTKKWDYRVSLSNITNEKNWAPPNSVYGNASIFALPGTMGQLTIKHSF